MGLKSHYLVTVLCCCLTKFGLAAHHSTACRAMSVICCPQSFLLLNCTLTQKQNNAISVRGINTRIVKGNRSCLAAPLVKALLPHEGLIVLAVQNAALASKPHARDNFAVGRLSSF